MTEKGAENSAFQKGAGPDGRAAFERLRLRICHVVVRPELDGAQRSMLDLCGHPDDLGYQRSVICAGEGPLTEVLRARAIPYYLAPALCSPLRPHRDLLALVQLIGICRRQRFDLIHTHTSKGGFIGRLAARIAGVPRVVHHVRGYAFHGESTRYERWLYSALEAGASRLTDRVIFVNHEERLMSLERGLVPDGRALTIYNGVDLARFDPAAQLRARQRFRDALHLGPDESAILVCGRLERQKQPLILPRIAAGLHALDPQGRWRILVVGSGSYEAALREAVHAHGMHRRITLLGKRDDPAEVFCGCDIALLPSLWEGLPRVLIEAQAAGLPAVASDIKGNREVLTADTGILCRAKLPDDYAQALYRLMRDPGARQRMSAAALARAAQLFDVRELRLAVRAVYDELLR